MQQSTKTVQGLVGAPNEKGHHDQAKLFFFSIFYSIVIIVIFPHKHTQKPRTISSWPPLSIRTDVRFNGFVRNWRFEHWKTNQTTTFNKKKNTTKLSFSVRDACHFLSWMKNNITWIRIYASTLSTWDILKPILTTSHWILIGCSVSLCLLPVLHKCHIRCLGTPIQSELHGPFNLNRVERKQIAQWLMMQRWIEDFSQFLRKCDDMNMQIATQIRKSI